MERHEAEDVANSFELALIMQLDIQVLICICYVLFLVRRRLQRLNRPLLSKHTMSSCDRSPKSEKIGKLPTRIILAGLWSHLRGGFLFVSKAPQLSAALPSPRLLKACLGIILTYITKLTFVSSLPRQHPTTSSARIIG